jgi:hypothetical protein
MIVACKYFLCYLNCLKRDFLRQSNELTTNTLSDLRAAPKKSVCFDVVTILAGIADWRILTWREAVQLSFY